MFKLLEVKNEKLGSKYVLIDKEDFDKVNSHKWYYTKTGNKFYVANFNNKNFLYLHRFLLNPPEDMTVDHINGNELDNRKANLRIATYSQNQMNRGKQKNNKSGYIGVSWNKKDKKWRAQIKLNYKIIYIGNFDTKEKASLAYLKKQKELFKDFAFKNI